MSHTEQPLYQRDPDEYQRHLAEGNRRQARKRVGADALLRDHNGRILLVDPVYKPLWDLPGGMCEDNEAPDHALRRELTEELGLHLPATTALPLLVVDWVAPHGNWDDSVMLIFGGGILTPEQIADLHITDTELDAWEFVTPEQARPRLKPYYWQRVSAAVEAADTGTCIYRRTEQFPAP